MAHRFAEIAFTPQVRAIQEKNGSAAAYAAHLESPEQINTHLRDSEAAFIAERDSFYIASVGETGWPYVQHRGGSRGFLKVLDAHTVGFADFRGNRQYVSLGNISGEGRVCLFLMDYPHRTRLKLFGRASITNHPDVIATLSIPGYRGRVESGWLIKIEGFDWNCAQHITPRFTEDEVAAAVAPLHAQIRELQKENAALVAMVDSSRTA